MKFKTLIRRFANGLRKVANKIDNDSSLNILNENVIIHPLSKISYNRIKLKKTAQLVLVKTLK